MATISKSWLLNINKTRSAVVIALVCVIIFFQIYREFISGGGLEHQQQMTIAHNKNKGTNIRKNALVYGTMPIRDCRAVFATSASSTSSTAYV